MAVFAATPVESRAHRYGLIAGRFGAPLEGKKHVPRKLSFCGLLLYTHILPYERALWMEAKPPSSKGADVTDIGYDIRMGFPKNFLLCAIVCAWINMHSYAVSRKLFIAI